MAHHQYQKFTAASGSQQVYVSTSLVAAPAAPSDTTKPAVAINQTTGEVDWNYFPGTGWVKARQFDIVGQFTPTLSGGSVINTQDAGRITNAALPAASATYEGVILEVSGLTANITPTSGPLVGITLNNGDMIICESSNGTYTWKKLESNANDRTLSPRRNQGNATMSFDVNSGQIMIDTRAVNDLPQGYLAGSYYEFKQNAAIGLTFAGVGTYSAVHTIRAWSGIGNPLDASGGNFVFQYAYASDGRMYRRTGTISTNTRGPWIASDDDHLTSGTRAAIIALRAAGTLVPGRSYEITDHVQGRLVAGTTVTLLATSTSEFSMDARVNTTYDNVSWFGLYDIDTAVVYELTDNRMNTCKGLNGTEVSNFDWGNTAYYNNWVEGATLTVTYGNTAPVHGNDIRNATVNLTGFTGSFYRNKVHTAANWNLTNANGTWRYNECKNGSSINMTGYTGGGDSHYNEFDAVTFNLTGQTGACVFRQNEVFGSSWTLAGAGTCTITNCNFVQQNISKPIGAGNITLNLCTSRESGSIQLTGTGALSMTGTQNNGTVQIQSTGNLTVNYSRLEQSCVFRNAGTAGMSIIRTTSDGANSSVYTDAGSSTVMNVTDCIIQNSGIIRVVGAVGGGAFNVSGTRVASSSYIYKRGTGALTVNASELIGASRIDVQSGNRSYTFNRIRMSEAARATMTGTGAVTDVINDLVLQNRGGLIISCSGAANALNYNSISGLSAQITLSGTTGNQVIQRTHCTDATFTITNTSVAMTHDVNNFSQVGGCAINNVTAAKPLTYSSTIGGTINITNATVAGGLTRLQVRNGGNITVNNLAGTVSQVDCSQGGVTIPGGATHTNIIKTLGGVLNTGNFTSNNVAHHTSVSKTYLANNANRANYIGITSTAPIL